MIFFLFGGACGQWRIGDAYIPKIPIRIQNVVSVATGKNCSNSEITLHVAAKTRFAQLKNLSNTAISPGFGHILNPSVVVKFNTIWVVEYATC